MKIAVIGRGLIGGSLEKACRRAGFEVDIYPGRGEHSRMDGYDIVFLAVPPETVVRITGEIAPSLHAGAIVMDIAGVKTGIYNEIKQKYILNSKWHFVGAHPMAGKEQTGYSNSSADLFDGASIILTPYPTYGHQVIDTVENVLKKLGFGRIVYTNPEHHDKMIAYTSQLCHILSSIYVRDELSKEHLGYSGGSFRDLSRVGAPDPDLWTELFMENRKALLPVVDRYLRRLGDFREKLANGDRDGIHGALEQAVEAKKQI